MKTPPDPYAYCGRPLMVHGGPLGVVSGRVVAQLLDGYSQVQAVRVKLASGLSLWVPHDRIVHGLPDESPQTPTGAGSTPPGDSLAPAPAGLIPQARSAS